VVRLTKDQKFVDIGLQSTEAEGHQNIDWSLIFYLCWRGNDETHNDTKLWMLCHAWHICDTAACSGGQT